MIRVILFSSLLLFTTGAFNLNCTSIVQTKSEVDQDKNENTESDIQENKILDNSDTNRLVSIWNDNSRNNDFDEIRINHENRADQTEELELIGSGFCWGCLSVFR